MKSKLIDYLKSKTHLTGRSYIQIKAYNFVFTNHPVNKSHAEAGLFIRSTIRYEVPVEPCKNFLQAALVLK